MSTTATTVPAVTDASAKPAKAKKKIDWKALPEIWALIHPRRGLLLLGFVLMPIVLAVIAATVIQGLTSFTLTQLLSKSAQRMITELRKQVQAHIGRLPVSFYDANKTGVLVSRIMSDVEGVRNLIGTGLVEF